MLHRLDVAELQQRVLSLIGELAEDAGAVHRVFLAPDLLPLLDPPGRGQAGNHNPPGLDVGAVQGGDGDGAVYLPLLVEGSAKGSGHSRGVADEQQQRVCRGHHRLDGLVDVVADALGLVHDDEHVGTVKALELVGAVGGQSHGVTVVGKLPAGVQHLAAQGLGGRAVEAAQLPPEYVAHLPEGGRGAEGDGGVLVNVHEPQQGHGGAEALAETVARLDGHPAVLGEGVQHLHLLGPQLHAQHLAGEGHGGGRRRGRRPFIERRSRVILRCSPIILSLSKDGKQRVCRF